MSKVIVIGGGAAGMMASIVAARNGNEVVLYEKNEKLGKKLYITGKGRCNLTNACDMDGLFNAIVTNSKFMYSSLYGFTNEDALDFFHELGLKTKVERGDRVFPESDHSSDVIRTLEKGMRQAGVDLQLNTTVKKLLVKDNVFQGVLLENGKKISGDSCIVCTGGLSYQSTGSTGDGYRFAKEEGHTVTELSPSLVPMETKEIWIKDLQGLSLRNVEITIKNGKKKLYFDFGEMLFTHYGVSGPLILSASSYVGKKLKDNELSLTIDLKPALSKEQLDNRILRDFEENLNKQFKNSLNRLLPSKLIPIVIMLSGIDPEKKVNVVSREERQKLVFVMKEFPLTLTSLRGYNEAIITKGGIKIKEIDPGTMESKLVNGLHFAGEVLDLDAVTGGFNLQIAWSTAYAAGMSV